MNRKTKCPDEFRPESRVLELAKTQGIPEDFVESCVPEFIFYFQDKGTYRTSWQRSFWNWVKKGWSYKRQQEKSTRGLTGGSNKVWVSPEKREVSDKATARAKLAELKKSIY